MPFKFLSEVALADIAFEASASTPAGLFREAAKALTEVMVDRKTLRAKESVKIELEAETSERLLYDFLTELLVRKDVDGFLGKDYEISLSRGLTALTCIARGETIDRHRHGLRNDVKAITMHMFEIREKKGNWLATVVLDI